MGQNVVEGMACVIVLLHVARLQVFSQAHFSVLSQFMNAFSYYGQSMIEKDIAWTTGLGACKPVMRCSDE